jgi:hypothetical protein
MNRLILFGLLGCGLVSCSAFASITDVYLRIIQTGLPGRTVRAYADPIRTSGWQIDNPYIDYSIVSGGATIETQDGTFATIKLPKVTVDTSVIVRAASREKANISRTATIQVFAPNSSIPASDFAASNEYWQSEDRRLDNSGSASTTDVPDSTTYLTTQGNPDGHIEVEVYSGFLVYFSAPAKFLGPQTKVFGKTLRFDLIHPESRPQKDAEDIVMQSQNLKLVAPFLNPPNANWSTISVAMNATGGWRVGNMAGPMATDAQIEEVLKFVDALRIRTAFIEMELIKTESGDEVRKQVRSKLDNVRYTP